MNIVNRDAIGKADTQFHCHICGGLAATGETQFYKVPKKWVLDIKCENGHLWSIEVKCDKCEKVPEYGTSQGFPVLKCCTGFFFPNGYPRTDNPFGVEIEI